MSNDRDVDPVHAVADGYVRLLSLAAHELLTPASVVGGYLRMLQQDTGGPLSDRSRKMIDDAARSCGRLAALVGDLSEVARLDNGTARLTDDSFDLFAELEDVAKNVHEGEDRQVRLEVGGPSEGAPVKGDRRRLAAAFSALLHALLREQPAAVTMICDRRLVTRGSETLALIVIARAADRQRAADAEPLPFNDYRGGNGLSLPIARRVIERAGGRIWSPAEREGDGTGGLPSSAVVSMSLHDSTRPRA